MTPIPSTPSTQASLQRLQRGAAALLLALLFLEIVVRIPPARPLLSSALDPYENLLWYYPAMVSYQEQLRDGPHYDVWILGSSYVATSINPQAVQDQLSAAGHALTVQNYTFSLMQNLSDMATVVDRWMLPLNQPRAVLLGIHMGNASPNGQLPSKAHTSTMERAYIFQDTLDDRLGGFIYRSSALFRYLTLARNALTIPREETVVQDMPLGGYVANKDVYQCEESRWTDRNLITPEALAGSLERLDALLRVLQSHDIPVAVVGIPMPYCGYRRFYPNTDAYIQEYLEPVAAHLQALNIPYAEFDRRFFEAFPDSTEQLDYYNDASHPNERGAQIFSAWAADFLAEWLRAR